MSVLKLVTIDLRDADVPSFEAYEHRTIALLARHEGELLNAWRSTDGATEFHVLAFADASAFERFLADPARDALQDLWRGSGASASVVDVTERRYDRAMR